MPQTQFESIIRETMIDIILGSLLIFAAVVFAALLALFVLLWPLQKKREHAIGVTAKISPMVMIMATKNLM